MNSLIYAGVVVAGAITLLIEAYRNFNSSLTTIPFKEHPILKDMEVAQLCTSREKNIGFLFYSLLYLVTYVIILSSTEIYEIVSQAAKSNAEIGPTDALVGQGGDPFGLLDTQYGKPIFISAAIIAFFSLGALRPVESTMRSLAHRIAGVPRGVYSVIERLHAIEFRESDFDAKTATPLASRFEANAEAGFKDSYEVDQVDTIKTALRAIDYLSPAITGKLRIQYFPFTQLEAMSGLSLRLEEQIGQLRAMLKVKLAPEEAERTKLFNASMAAANDTIALFAVHFLRNNRAIKNLKKGTPIAEVNKKIREDYQIELNSFAMSLFVSFILAVTVGTFLVLNWNYTKMESQVKIAAYVEESLQTRENWEPDDIETCLASLPEMSFFSVRLNKPNSSADLTPLAKSKRDECEILWKRSARGTFFEVLQQSLNQTFWNMIGVALAVGLPAVSALFGRDVRREDNSWQDWKFRRIPFIRLASMAVVPAILAVMGVTLGAFLKVWFDSGFDLTENQIKFFFESSYVFFLMHAFVGFFVAVGVLVLIDQHDFLFSEISWIVGAIFGLVTLLFYYVIILVGYGPGFVQTRHQGAWFSFEIREMLVHGIMPFLFLFFFAVFLELTEDRAWRTGSILMRFLRRNKTREAGSQ
jgi:hypothetical protein